MQDAGPARQLAVGIRGVGRGRLVPAGDHAQRLAMTVEAVEQRQVALAGDAERELHVVQRELIGEQLPAAAESRFQKWRGVRGARSERG